MNLDIFVVEKNMGLRTMRNNPKTISREAKNIIRLRIYHTMFGLIIIIMFVELDKVHTNRADKIGILV